MFGLLTLLVSFFLSSPVFADSNLSFEGALQSCQDALADLALSASKRIDALRYKQADLALLASETQLNVVARRLTDNPNDAHLQDLFINSSSKLLYQGYENFNLVGRAYKQILTGLKYKKLSIDQFDLLIRSVETLPSFLYYPYSSSRDGVIGSLQQFISKVIVEALLTDPTFRTQDALAIVTQLRNRGITFTDYPQDWTIAAGPWKIFVRRWIFGEILRAATLTGKATEPVELAILDSIDERLVDVNSKMKFLGRLRKYKSRYKISDHLHKTIEDRFSSWVADISHLRSSDSAIARTVSKFDIEMLKKNSKEVLSLREFLLRIMRQDAKGVLLGIQQNDSVNVYDLVKELTSLTSFSSAYHRFLMSTNMDRLNEEQQKQKSRKFMQRLVGWGGEIVFLLPSDIERTLHTKVEFEYLIEDPQRLKNVTFVLGAYDP